MDLPLKTRVHRLIQSFGFDIRRFPSPEETGHRRAMLLQAHGIDLVIDVGANAGQYASELRRFGYAGRILSIEPLKSAFDVLSSAAQHDPLWSVLHAAVGAEEGTATIHVAGNSVSSSLLPMLPLHEALVPTSRYAGSEQVRVTTVDVIMDGDAARRVFLKIDTQGFEGSVLDGARRMLQRAAGVEVEMSLVALYDGQILLPELLHRIEGQGYSLFGITPGFADSSTGRLLQVDGVFFRE